MVFMLASGRTQDDQASPPEITLFWAGSEFWLLRRGLGMIRGETLGLVRFADMTNHEFLQHYGLMEAQRNDENALMKAAANQPVSIAMDAGGKDLQLYSEANF
ncbi:hypothetical protein DKX38_015016 [Salix brachista]|uniref:Uncharacterized protein n=1 Tax=Salix brachista TaxID=2182728 RepID=A0A5N5L424_9ROSI|nr:hypothetical protein DKX38_015016 [Salix brachista]